MKKILTAALLAATFAVNAQPGYFIAGTTTAGPGSSFYNFTPISGCGSMQAGSVWAPTTIDFTRPFEVTFDVMFDVGGITNGDGICAVFGSNLTSTSVGGTGGNLGYYGGSAAFTNSLGVEFDIFNNGTGSVYPLPLNDPGFYDHTQISLNSNPSPAMAGPVQILPSVANIKDGTFHHYKITWDCNNYMFVSVDGNLRLSYYMAPTVVTSTFTSPGSVPWGFTGATAGYCSNQIIKNILMTQPICACAAMPTACVVRDPSGLLDISCTSSTATVYYEVVDYAGLPTPGCAGMLFSASSFPALINYTSIMSACGPNSYGICITGICDNGCCWGRTPSTPTASKISPSCCAWFNVPRPGGNNTTGISQLNIAPGELAIIPNPNNGTFTIAGITTTSSEGVNVSIFDMVGKLVYSSSSPVLDGLTTQDINMDKGIPNGIYMVKVKDNNSIRVCKFSLNR